MKRFPVKLRLVAIGIFIWGRAAVSNPLTLEEFIRDVRASSPSIMASKYHALAERHRVDPSQTIDDPFIAVGVDQMPTRGADTAAMNRYQISQSIPFPGKLSARGNVAENRAVSAQADTDTITRQMTVFATQIYYKAVFTKRSLELNQKIKSLLAETIESTKARYQTGEQSHHEWLLGKMELSILNVDQLRMRREQRTIQALLNELRNQKPDEPIEVVESPFKDSKEIVNPDIQGQPELKALSARATAADSEVRFAKLSYFPDFTFQAMLEQPRNTMMDQSNTWGVMVGFNLPILFFRKQSELSAAAVSERESALAEKANIQNRLNTEVTDAREQLNSARDIVDLYKRDILPLTDLAEKNTQNSYAVKRASLSQLIDILRAKRTQELEFLGAQIDVELAKLRLREVLSSPPAIRFAPSRPTLFGNETMNTMGSSGTVNMGRGMSGPTRKPETSTTPSGSNKGMGGM